MAVALIASVWSGLTVYAVLGGADFGAGVLHLLARGPAAQRQREAIARTIGPVWEANHVWLLFALVGLFSAFPRAFGALATLEFVPATLVLLAIVVRGAALAFAGHADGEPKVRMPFERLAGQRASLPVLLRRDGRRHGARRGWRSPGLFRRPVPARARCPGGGGLRRAGRHRAHRRVMARR